MFRRFDFMKFLPCFSKGFIIIMQDSRHEGLANFPRN